MEFEKIIEIIEDVKTLQNICRMASKQIWQYKFEYDCAKTEIEELKKTNEKLQKLLENEKGEREAAEATKIDNIVIQMGGK